MTQLVKFDGAAFHLAAVRKLYSNYQHQPDQLFGVGSLSIDVSTQNSGTNCSQMKNCLIKLDKLCCESSTNNILVLVSVKLKSANFLQ